MSFDLVFHVNRKDAESAKKRYFSFAVVRTAKEKNQSLRDIIRFLNARRACCLLFSILSTKNYKIINICVLCVCDLSERLVGS